MRLALYNDVPVYSVQDIAQQVKLTLEDQFSLIAVVGEISNYTLHSSGHAYFTIKDSGAQISAVMFRASRLSIQCQLKDGIKIKAFGKVSLYSKTGRYQIVLKHVDHMGQGALEQKLRELMEKLKKEGLFDAPKKELPLFPLTVGVITSPTGAAIQDILRVSRRRYPLAEVRLYPARVQGEGAHKEIIEGIRYFKQHPVDVLIIGRGGGSIEDLWAFNEEELAYEVFDYPYPIVSAVGHEIDHSVTDFVADVRAATPSVAAEIVFPDQQEQQRYLIHVFNRLSVFVQSKIRRSYDLLHSVGRLSYFYNQVKSRIDEGFQDADYLLDRLKLLVQSYLSNQKVYLGELENEVMKRNVLVLIQKSFHQLFVFYRSLNDCVDETVQRYFERLKILSEKLSVLSPLETLSRGYAMIQDSREGQIIQSIQDIECDQILKISVKDGFFEAQVVEKEGKEG